MLLATALELSKPAILPPPGVASFRVYSHHRNRYSHCRNKQQSKFGETSMEFKLNVTVEQRHIDVGSKQSWPEKDAIGLAIWDAAKKTPPFDFIWDLIVDLTGITLYVGTD